MDAVVTEDQRMVLDTSVRFIEEAYPLAKVRSGAFAEDDERARYLEASAALGWYSMLVPDELGGGSVTDNGLLDAVLIAAKRGAGLQPGPFVATNVVAHALASGGTDSHRAEVIPALVSGAATAAWVVGAPVVPASAGGEIVAEVDGDDVVLNGTAKLVHDAVFAGWLLVTAGSRDGLVQVLLRADAAGVTIEQMDSLDLSRTFSTVRLDGVRAGAADAVGSPGEVAGLVERQLAIACVLTAAESVGAMERDFDTALQYSKDRIAFGRPIGSFQAIKHVLADTSLALEMSKAITLAAAETLGSGDEHGVQIAAMAKAFVNDAGQELAQHCFQIFGGIGFTWEHDQHLYLRRLATDAVLYGAPDFQRERLCQLAGL
jgi:alkylation response protein AidB-like acyl-CoA dehydrogenase